MTFTLLGVNLPAPVMSIAKHLFLDTLRHSQWLAPPRILRYQQSLLEPLVRHAALQTKFYPDRLRPIFANGSASESRVDFSAWEQIPVVTRRDALRNADSMRAATVPNGTGAIVSGESSGSTGEPLRHVRSAFVDIAANCQLDRTLEVSGIDPYGSFAFINFDSEDLYPYPEGRSLKGWNTTAMSSPFFLLDIRTAPEDQLEWIERVRPDYLMCYPNNLRAVAEVAFRKGGARHELKEVLATGEILTEETRHIISQTFKCRVINHYGAREIGQIAFQCPEAKGFHVCSETVLLEIVRHDGTIAEPGEQGRVVVTSLYNYAMPFIRYDLGDFASLSGIECPCGRGLPHMTELVGRIRNLFVMPDGTRKWPAMTSAMAALFPYQQFQIIQTDVNVIQFFYIPTDGSDNTDPNALLQYLRKLLHPDLSVEIIPVDAIRRSAGQKFEPFVSLVQ